LERTLGVDKFQRVSHEVWIVASGVAKKASQVFGEVIGREAIVLTMGLNGTSGFWIFGNP
jgi:hypothetical protein